MPGINLWHKAQLTRWLTALALCCVASVGWSAPRTPSDAGEVLERLAVKAGDPDASRLKQYQQAVNRAPKDAQTVTALARLYFDLAMTHGVNYPKGLLAWADELGIPNIVDQMDALYHEYYEDRYRCSPLLRKMARENRAFYEA